MIADGASPADVRDRYSLTVDGHDRVSVLDVEPGTTMRAGTVDEWPEHGLDGGGEQYAIREPSLKKHTRQMVEDDFPGHFPDDEEGIPIEKALNGEIELPTV